MNKLFEKCREFLKRATELKVSLVENNDPILKQLSELKDFDDRVELAKKHWKLLGEGSSRIVFQISDDLIIKIAYNNKGIAQDKVEAEFDLQKPCVANVVVADPEGKWLIMKFTETMTKQDFKKIVGFGFETFMNALFYAYNNESDEWVEPKEYDKIKEHPLFKCLGEMVVDGNCLLGDFDKTSSFGIRDGKVYLRDWGFNKAVNKDYYEDKTPSKSSPPKTSS
jgi:hypothetical protein